MSLLLLKYIFGSPHIIKLAWGFGGPDLKMLRQAGDDFFRPAFESVNGVLDLSEVIGRSLKTQALGRSSEGLASLPSSAPKELLKSLAKKDKLSVNDACQIYFGKPLSKREQLSNWIRRPLNAAQKEYAALDAHCMLSVFESAQLQKDDAWRAQITYGLGHGVADDALDAGDTGQGPEEAGGEVES
jgi:hypothetical protein